MSYRVAPFFLIRLAGVPFEAIERLATPVTTRAVRDLLVRQKEFSAEDEARLSVSLDRELVISRTWLLDAARTILPGYLIFAAEGMRERTASLLADYKSSGVLPQRNSRVRERERHLLLYLQRIAAKNDTFSQFGPSGWGKVDNGADGSGATWTGKPERVDEPGGESINRVHGIALAPRSGVAAREAFLERWTAHAIAAAINGDAEFAAEFPNNKIEVPALEPHAFDVIYDDLQKLQPGAAREKWLSILQPIADAPAKFIAAAETEDRQIIFDGVRQRLQSLGAVRKVSDRFLYSAANPIGEECFRECNFSISADLIGQVANDAAPWIDFWRDSYAFVASRVASGLRQLLQKAQIKDAIPLPAFLRLCETAKLPLTGPGLVALSVMAFQEIKAALREQMRAHVDLAEYELTPDDCHIVRKNFQYPKFDEYTYPSADLQIAAESVEAVARGDYQWILSELHPPAALLHHCMYWSCPDKSTLNHALASTACGRPSFHFGFFAADFTSHTTVRLFDALPELSNFVAPQRANPRWRTTAPAEAEVYIDEASGDVCVRKMGSREYLGSFARAWIIPLGFHPFQFGMTPQMPRLRCGRVIVQRRAWTVTQDELGAGNYKGVSRDLVIAVERLRAQKGWPRFVYIRPTEQALRRSGAEGRDKDTKPVFVDLESYLFLEIFHRWLTKSGELEVTEMLPDPDHLLWKEPDGRRTFELRTLITPRS